MKQYFFVSALYALTMSTFSYGFTGFGLCNFGNETRNNVICYGPTILKSTIVKGDVKVAGTLRAYGATMGPLTIKGSADIQDATVKGPTVVTGNINVVNSTFQNDVAITAKKANFSHSNINGTITMSSHSASPSLTLECQTIVRDVKFDDKPGVVLVTQDSMVQQKVINGTIVFIQKTCPPSG